MMFDFVLSPVAAVVYLFLFHPPLHDPSSLPSRSPLYCDLYGSTVYPPLPHFTHRSKNTYDFDLVAHTGSYWI